MLRQTLLSLLMLWSLAASAQQSKPRKIRLNLGTFSTVETAPSGTEWDAGCWYEKQGTDQTVIYAGWGTISDNAILKINGQWQVLRCVQSHDGSKGRSIFENKLYRAVLTITQSNDQGDRGLLTVTQVRTGAQVTVGVKGGCGT